MEGRLTAMLKADHMTALACQGDTTNLSCENYEGIRVTDAFWGRDNKIDCQSDDPLEYLTHKETCSPLDHDYAYRKVTELCEKKDHCTIAGTPLFFDTELCPHVRKFVRVEFECREMSGMRKSDVEKGSKKSLIDSKNHTTHSQMGNFSMIEIKPIVYNHREKMETKEKNSLKLKRGKSQKKKTIVSAKQNRSKKSKNKNKSKYSTEKMIQMKQKLRQNGKFSKRKCFR